MTGAADGILRHVALGREAAGYAVVAAAARRGNVKQQAVQRPYSLLVYLHAAHQSLVIKHAQQVAPHKRRPRRRAAHGVDHRLRHRHRHQGVGGEIHLIQIAPPHHRQVAGQGGESDLRSLRMDISHHDAGGSQRGMAAQVDLAAGGKPAQTVLVPIRHGKGRFGQVVLSGNGHHGVLRQPTVHHTDGGGIAGKYPVGERVHHILLQNGLFHWKNLLILPAAAHGGYTAAPRCMLLLKKWSAYTPCNTAAAPGRKNASSEP